MFNRYVTFSPHKKIPKRFLPKPKVLLLVYHFETYPLVILERLPIFYDGIRVDDMVFSNLLYFFMT